MMPPYAKMIPRAARYAAFAAGRGNRRIATMTRERDEWARKAEFALTRDREDLARGALMAKAQITRSLEDAQNHLANIVHGLEAQNSDIAQLQAKHAQHWQQHMQGKEGPPPSED